jgi:hypothetical protein
MLRIQVFIKNLKYFLILVILTTLFIFNRKVNMPLQQLYNKINDLEMMQKKHDGLRINPNKMPIIWQSLNTRQSKIQSCNPSIVLDGNIKIFIRLVNYEMNHGIGLGLTTGSITMSKYAILNLNENLVVETKIQYLSDDISVYLKGMISVGLEDLRLIKYKTKVLGTASLNINHIIEIVLVELDLIENRVTKIMKLVNLDFGEVWQKNWMPFIYQGELYWIITVAPLTIIKLIKTTKSAFEVVIIHNLIHELNNSYHGSSNGVEISPGEFLFLIHCKDLSSPNRIIYKHAWLMVYLNDIIRFSVSENFHFIHHNGVEMATSLVLKGDDLLIGLSIEDEDILIGMISIDKIILLL